MSRQAIDGIFLLDKPTGMSSNAALQKAKYLMQAKKAGHTGSLDPAASGLLPICFGEATKYAQYMLASDKTYFCHAHFGVQTTTGDREGAVMATQPIDNINRVAIENALSGFLGRTQQIPSMYSALKHHGQPLYKLARQGIEVQRQPREISVYKLQCHGYQAPIAHLEVSCSKGTYIRNLVEDIGAQLGCGAHVAELRRTQVGHYMGSTMMTFEQLASRALCERRQLLQPIASALQDFDALELNAAQYRQLSQGKCLPEFTHSADKLVRVEVLGHGFVGLGRLDPTGLRAKRLLATQSILSTVLE